jgi:hypothetical protein
MAGTEVDLANVMTLAEWAKRPGMNPGLDRIIEALSSKNTALSYLLMKEANRGFNNLTNRRTHEPSGEERAINKGVPASSSRTTIVTETSCLIEDWSEIDEILVDSSDNPKQARFDEDVAHLHGLRRKFSTRFFYGDPATDALQIRGLATRRPTLDDETNVYDNAEGAASVTANKTSAYIVQMGEDKFHGFYPKNLPNGNAMGLGISMIPNPKAETKEEYDATIGKNRLRKVYRTQFKLQFGLAERDVRALKRVCNISCTNIDGVDDFLLNVNVLRKAIMDLEDGGSGAVIFGNKHVFYHLAQLADQKGNVWWDKENPFGVPILKFFGLPVIKDDEIKSDEATVVEAA